MIGTAASAFHLLLPNSSTSAVAAAVMRRRAALCCAAAAATTSPTSFCSAAAPTASCAAPSAIRRRRSSSGHRVATVRGFIPPLAFVGGAGSTVAASKSARIFGAHSRRLFSTKGGSKGGGGKNDGDLLGDVDYRAKVKQLQEDGELDSTVYDPPDSIIEARTLDWIKRVVIGLNLCPFADRPLKSEKLTVHVVRGRDDHTIAAAVLYEMFQKVEEPGTAVVVAPEFHPSDFREYLKMVAFLEGEVMEEREIDGLVQLAPFHPLFEFEGSGSDGADNYTNRSPYPMFHVLREDEVGAAVEKLGGDASKVWSRNVGLMRNLDRMLGRDEMAKAMQGKDVEGLEDVLRETREEFGDTKPGADTEGSSS